MSPTRRRPTRRDLLIVIEQLQDIIGRARGANHDRNPNRFAEVDGLLSAAFDYCLKARNHDPPVGSRPSPWRGIIVPRDTRFV
jgi:hypothetical protein